jgi:hypothetical protein
MSHDSSSKDNPTRDAGEASGRGGGRDGRTLLVRGMAFGANEEGQAAHTVGFLQKPPTTDKCEVLGPDPAQYRVTFTYKNYRGEISTRLIYPLGIVFGATEWHPQPQWLLTAFDIQKNAERTFAMKDISDWTFG